jgi:hypothetical protein
VLAITNLLGTIPVLCKFSHHRRLYAVETKNIGTPLRTYYTLAMITACLDNNNNTYIHYRCGYCNCCCAPQSKSSPSQSPGPASRSFPAPPVAYEAQSPNRHHYRFLCPPTSTPSTPTSLSSQPLRQHQLLNSSLLSLSLLHPPYFGVDLATRSLLPFPLCLAAHRLNPLIRFYSHLLIPSFHSLLQAAPLACLLHRPIF